MKYTSIFALTVVATASARFLNALPSVQRRHSCRRFFRCFSLFVEIQLKDAPRKPAGHFRPGPA